MFKKIGLWFCRVLDSHKQPLEIGFDGCSMTGRCPRCGKRVLQDSQGNWFSSSTQDLPSEAALAARAKDLAG